MIGQLIKIHTVPIKIDIKTNRGSIDYSTELPTVDITRHKGELRMKNTPAKVNMDSYEMRASIGLKTAKRIIEEQADIRIKKTYEAIKSIVQKGNNLANPKGPSIEQMAKQSIIKKVETYTDFLPKAKIKFSVDKGSLDISYTPDKIEIKANNVKIKYDFERAKVTGEVVQRPEVNIEYIGEPIYVPPSYGQKVIGGEINTKV